MIRREIQDDFGTKVCLKLMLMYPTDRVHILWTLAMSIRLVVEEGKGGKPPIHVGGDTKGEVEMKDKRRSWVILASL